jgi:hypothetical protein
MVEEEIVDEITEEGGAEEAPEAQDEGKPVMCFISKQMVPEGRTVEVEHAPGKKVRVQAKYIRYETAAPA